LVLTSVAEARFASLGQSVEDLWWTMALMQIFLQFRFSCASHLSTNATYSSITRGWYIRPIWDHKTKRLGLTPLILSSSSVVITRIFCNTISWLLKFECIAVLRNRHSVCTPFHLSLLFTPLCGLPSNKASPSTSVFRKLLHLSLFPCSLWHFS
jgi:hypothetical protein